MSPVELYALSTTFSAVSNLINGNKTRKQQAEFRKEDRADTRERFETDISLRRDQFLFTQREAERARILRLNERNEDFERQKIRDQNARSFDHLRTVFNGSPDGIWLHDPYAGTSGIQSLRIFLQRPKGKPESFHTGIERKISAAIKKYGQVGPDHPIHFPTGVWKEQPASGSWVAGELHAWNQTIPTLILRLDPSDEGGYFVQADIFGFPIGNRNFADNVTFGYLPDNSQQIAEVLPLLALATADMYHVYTYGKRPLLPFLLADHIPQIDSAAAPTINQIVAAYQGMVNALARETPEVGIYAAINLAEALIEFPDKSHAIGQIQHVEALTSPLLPSQPHLREVIGTLYKEAGAPQDAARFLEATQEQGRNPALDYKNLEKYL